MKWINGNKTLIGAVLMLIVSSDYVESLITNPDLYMLAQGISGLILAGGAVHKGAKAMKITK